MPYVKHLGIACNHLRVCPTCMPWQETTVDLHFKTADETTLMHLTSSQQLTLLPAKCELGYRRAYKLDNADSDFVNRFCANAVKFKGP